MTLIHRRDPARGMARFYLIDTYADLFGGVGVLREWGRIGRAGQLKTEAHPETPTAERLTAMQAAQGIPVMSCAKLAR